MNSQFETNTFNMYFSIGGSIAQNLFLMLFSLCVAATVSVILPSMFNTGVGIFFKEGFLRFFIRALFMGVFFLLCSISFVLGFSFIEHNSASGFFSTLTYVFLIIIFSMSPWFCDHLGRLLLFPARKIIELREKEFKYVDILFVSIYIVLILILLLIWKLME